MEGATGTPWSRGALLEEQGLADSGVYILVHTVRLERHIDI